MRIRQLLIGLACVVALPMAGIALGTIPASASCSYTYCGTTSTLYAGQSLHTGDWITSGNGVFSLTMQSDSNLVLRDEAYVPHWASGTWSIPKGAWLAMQTDGNLVIYSADARCQCGVYPYWASGTNGFSGAYVAMQNDGNLVIYSSTGYALWASNTWTYTTSMGAGESSYGKPDNGVASNGTGWHSAHSTVHVWCQTNVGADTGHWYSNGQPMPGNFTWDNLAEGGWVPDWHVETPVVGSDGYSSGVRRCQRNGPLTVTTTIANYLNTYPATPGATWLPRDSSGNPLHSTGPLFNDGGDYWQSVHAEATGSALAAGNCQDLVLANSNFWWLFDTWNSGSVLNNVDTWGSASSNYGRLAVTSNPQVGDVVVFGHVQNWTPNGHVASVIRVDSDGFVIAEFNFFGKNGGGNGILDFRKVTSSTPDDPIAFIR